MILEPQSTWLFSTVGEIASKLSFDGPVIPLLVHCHIQDSEAGVEAALCTLRQ